MPFANKIVNVAHKLGKLYEFAGVDIDDRQVKDVEVEAKKISGAVIDNQIREKLPNWVGEWAERVNEAWSWQWDGDAPVKDWKKAEAMLSCVVGVCGHGGEDKCPRIRSKDGWMWSL